MRARSCRAAAGRMRRATSSVCTTIRWFDPPTPVEAEPPHAVSNASATQDNGRTRSRRGASAKAIAAPRLDHASTREQRRSSRSHVTPSAADRGIPFPRGSSHYRLGRGHADWASRFFGTPSIAIRAAHHFHECIQLDSAAYLVLNVDVLARPHSGATSRRPRFEAIRSRCRRHRRGAGRGRRGLDRTVQHRRSPMRASSLAFEAKFETAGDFYRPVRLRLFGSRPARRPARRAVTPRSTATTTWPVTGRRPRAMWRSAAPAATRLLAAVLALRAGRRSGQGSRDDRRRHDRLQHRLVLPQAGVHRRDARCAGTSTRPTMSGRKWTQVHVRRRRPTRPATRPASDYRGGIGSRRGTGGFDLGYTIPDFRDPNGPTTGILPQGGTLAGLKTQSSGAFDWFQDQDSVDDPGYRWSGQHHRRASPTRRPATSTASRTSPNNMVRFTQATPDGDADVRPARSDPAGPVRVVFQDDNYNPPKDDGYDPERADLALGQHPGLHR